MAGPGDATNRERLYAENAREGRVLGRDFTFYSGAATTPTSYTGNLVLGTSGDGPGAYLLDGVGPPIPDVAPCEEVVVASLVCDLVGDDLTVTLLYNAVAGDVYVLFNTGTAQLLKPTSVTPVVGGVEVVFDVTSPPTDAGSWSFKVMRAANPTGCFAVRSGCLVIAPVVCTISLTGISGDGVFPNVPLMPGDSGTVSLTGTGFLSGALTVTMPVAFGGPTSFTVDLVTVIDDSNMDIDFTTVVGETGQWGVRVELASDPTCFDEIGFVLDEGVVVAVA